MARSVMSHQFSQVPKADIQRSSFNRSHGYKTTFDAGYLIPFFVDEALPGDSFNLNTQMFARLATPLKPIMDNMFLDTFYFAVPNRLLWDNWKKFNGEQINPGDSTSFFVPVVTAPAGGLPLFSIWDYFGVPTGVANIAVNALFHRAYNLIWNEWFRDQNLQTSAVVDKGDGPDTYTNYVLRRRGKRHDYFTSCLPWPQKGPDVTLPLGTTAPIKGLGIQTATIGTATANTDVHETPNVARTAVKGWVADPSAAGGADNKVRLWVEQTGVTNYPAIYADLTAATAATINSLRQAFQLQKLYERDARGGTRYIEIVKSHFGVTSPDARMQRPEYLGGSSSPVNCHPVAQTANTPAVGTPQGNLAAFGTVSQRNGFTKSFTEHCVVIGLLSVRADLTYQQGLDRMFSRRSRFDFYWPALAHIGEQAVTNLEIYATGVPATDAGVFGYQERFAEYRYKPSRITGKFRSNAGGTLDYWHLSQNFTALPTLNATFIEDNPPIARVIAVPAEPHFILDAYMDYKCARPMPVYSVPGLIDHF